VRLPHRLQFGLDLAQTGGFRLETVLRFAEFLLDACALALGVALLRVPQPVLGEVEFFLQRMIVLRHFGLCRELVDLVFKFALDVLDPVQVVARILQPRLGLARRSLYLETPAASSR
jgi:hypothetical protein